MPASKEAFDRGQVNQSLQVFREGRLKLREVLRLQPESNSLMKSRAGLNECSVNGLMIAGPIFDAEAVNDLLENLRDTCAAVDELAAVSLNDEFIQVRYLGNCSEAARLLFTRCWKLIRPQLLGRDGCEPRIWAT